MAAFNARNEASEESNSVKGGRGESPERAAGAGSSVPAASPKTGSTVRLKDGTHAKVAYAPPKTAPLPVYRMTADDGKRVHVHARNMSSSTALDHSGGPPPIRP
jgi:hypothetical protein